MSAAQLYRQTKLGDCLVESLDELITQEKLTPDLAIRILSEYDAVRAAMCCSVWSSLCRKLSHAPWRRTSVPFPPQSTPDCFPHARAESADYWCI